MVKQTIVQKKVCKKTIQYGKKLSLRPIVTSLTKEQLIQITNNTIKEVNTNTYVLAHAGTEHWKLNKKLCKEAILHLLNCKQDIETANNYLFAIFCIIIKDVPKNWLDLLIIPDWILFASPSKNKLFITDTICKDDKYGDILWLYKVIFDISRGYEGVNHLK